ncbi:hypothetical protein ACPC54_35240 [Kitasatospora sp. NPDC094028]
MQRFVLVSALTSALVGLGTPALAADPDPAPATTVTVGDAVIDPKQPGKVRVNVSYVCTIAAEARSLTVSVEQKDPQDASSIGFGTSRSAESDVICDGTQQQRQIIVQSKTFNWIADADAVLTSTVTNIGANPPASADARRVTLVVG